MHRFMYFSCSGIDTKVAFLLTLPIMTYAEAEKNYILNLSLLYNEEEAKALALYALQHVCDISKAQLLLNKQNKLSLQDEASLEIILFELKSGRPIQYVIGETEFYGLRFKVNPSVLIPRPETEELVDWILKEIKERVWEKSGEQNALKILDIGTGSGCIPIALKKHLVQAEISAIDISASALETAMHNSVINQTEVQFLQADILSSTINYQLPTFNIIVSNPPYVTEKEQEQMHSNVMEYEPHTALFVPDNDPLLFYNRIGDFAKNYLEPEGLLFFEINEHNGLDTVALLKDKGFNQVELRQDLMGKNRMIKAAL
jgi:release factor glutamine methyltransferase